MAITISGGCACGKIRYESASAPKFSIICQCRQCQHISGSGHAAQFCMAGEETQITGAISYYVQKSESGSDVSSGFCANCGSPDLERTSSKPDLLFIHAGTLDDPTLFKPEMVVYETSAPPWDHLDPSISRK